MGALELPESSKPDAPLPSHCGLDQSNWPVWGHSVLVASGGTVHPPPPGPAQVQPPHLRAPSAPDLTTSLQRRQRSTWSCSTDKESGSGRRTVFCSRPGTQDPNEPLTAMSPSKRHMAQALRPNSPGGRWGCGGGWKSPQSKAEERGPGSWAVPGTPGPGSAAGRATLTWVRVRHCTQLMCHHGWHLETGDRGRGVRCVILTRKQKACGYAVTVDAPGAALAKHSKLGYLEQKCNVSWFRRPEDRAPSVACRGRMVTALEVPRTWHHVSGRHAALSPGLLPQSFVPVLSCPDAPFMSVTVDQSPPT